MTSEPGSRRRRRRRAVWRAGAGTSGTQERSPAGPTEPVAPSVEAAEPAESSVEPPDQPATEAVATTPAPADDQPSPPPKRRRGDPSERGLRDLVGGGPSQVGPVRAMRARDVNRPDDADLAEAEENVVVVRRNWKPPKP